MTSWLQRYLVLLLLIASELANAQQAVVVVAADLSFDQLTSIELRKLYFGIPVSKGGITLRAVRNMSNAELNEIFLQSVVSASERDYDRRLLTLTAQSGRPRPLVETSNSKVISQILANPGHVTLVWREDVQDLINAKKLKVARVIWQSD